MSATLQTCWNQRAGAAEAALRQAQPDLHLTPPRRLALHAMLQADRPVTTRYIAAATGQSIPAAFEMLRGLRGRGVVTSESRRGRGACALWRLVHRVEVGEC